MQIKCNFDVLFRWMLYIKQCWLLSNSAMFKLLCITITIGIEKAIEKTIIIRFECP